MHTRRYTFTQEDVSGCNVNNGLSLAERVHPKYRPVFEKLSEADRAAVALYFLPHSSKKDVLEVTRPRVVKWYCPFADQREFPSGHRYCIGRAEYKTPDRLGLLISSARCRATHPRCVAVPNAPALLLVAAARKPLSR